MWPTQQWAGQRLLLAVSGGADSVAMVRAFLRLAPNRELLTIAHFNHGWRGAESDADESFVADLCLTFGLEFVVGSAQAELALHGDNLECRTRKSEESARKLRYRFLTRTARELDARFLLTAHTASDRVETMLPNLCRGTGLSGTCTPQLFRQLPSGVTLVRPLIGCFREQVEAYLLELGQEYRHDSTNDQQIFRRNFLRHSVVPLLREAYGLEVEERLLSYSRIVEETLEALRSLADDYWKNAQQTMQNDLLLRKFPGCPAEAIAIPDSLKLPAQWPVVHQALQTQWQRQGWPLQAMSNRHWARIRRFWDARERHKIAGRPRINLPGGIDMRVRRGWLILTNCGNSCSS